MTDQAESGAIRAALSRLRRTTEIPVAFAGMTGEGRGYRITEMTGTTTQALRGLAIAPGNGLGGKAVALARPTSVTDYRSSRVISHEYDAAVAAEGLRSVLAVPVVVRRRVRGVVYAALRESLALGDRALDTAADAVRELEQTLAVREEAQRLMEAQQTAVGDPRAWEEVREAHAELRTLAQRLPEGEVRRELLDACGRLASACGPDADGKGRPGEAVSLTPREVDIVSCIAGGGTNAAVAARTGLKPETVKAYLRSAMRKLGTHTRLETVVAARRAGIIP
ncbi:response regulator [Streptomyces abyssalis]|uniref:Response regulator n=1 Tax=Streptomyces abyssalis TaxID=933944 RepID=A0A1E7JSV0_9ACTN|nr:helix-turn-helix transcriptional regulator [Streptomyces abyssalis]OEU91959.1 response regulator [Streptomyces abyssalis]OEU93897.1 response regulator [Streptomyces abyssalis]OEV29320.1 response regulator [Streptomyces nanshensis]